MCHAFMFYLSQVEIATKVKIEQFFVEEIVKKHAQ